MEHYKAGKSQKEDLFFIGGPTRQQPSYFLCRYFFAMSISRHPDDLPELFIQFWIVRKLRKTKETIWRRHPEMVGCTLYNQWKCGIRDRQKTMNGEGEECAGW